VLRSGLSAVSGRFSIPLVQRRLIDLAEADYHDDKAGAGLPAPLVARVASVLSPYPMAISEIARAADISSASFAAFLVEFELQGIAYTVYGGSAGRKPPS